MFVVTALFVILDVATFWDVWNLALTLFLGVGVCAGLGFGLHLLVQENEGG